jgi:acetoacetyl-CoA synthetase
MSDLAFDIRPFKPVSLPAMSALWVRVLRLSPIGPDDDFFELGGDSLLALNLFHEIERVFGRALPITAIYDAPTPVRLVALLKGADPPAASPFALLKPGEGEALFIVHGIGGTVIELRALGRALDTARPVYGIQAKGVDGAAAPLDRMAAMVGHYLAAIRAVQPHGPYFLAGYSFGGLVAMELARQLERDGRDVALVGMIDSFAHPRTFPKLARALVRMKTALELFRTKPWREAAATLIGRVRGTGGELLPALFPEAEATPALRKVHDSAFAALVDYTPRPYPGAVHFFRPRTSIFPIAPGSVWGELIGALTIHPVAGDHGSMVRSEVASLAAALSRELRRAGSER